MAARAACELQDGFHVNLGAFTVARQDVPSLSLIKMADGVSMEEIRAKRGASFRLQLRLR